jgi:transcriptional regulator with XRE-family HTH domain
MREKHWQTLQKIERGEVNISVKRIEQIATALGVNPAELVDPEMVGATSKSQRGLQLNEQAANALAVPLAVAALADPNPPEGTVQIVALALQGIFRTIAEDPEVATDPKMARLAARLLNRPPDRAAN